MTEYLIVLALLFLFSLTWSEQPARDPGRPDRTDTNKRKENHPPTHPL